MGKQTVTTWTCDGCGVEWRRSPSNWLETTLHRQSGENSHTLHSMLLCVNCQERMLDALKEQVHP